MKSLFFGGCACVQSRDLFHRHSGRQNGHPWNQDRHGGTGHVPGCPNFPSWRPLHLWHAGTTTRLFCGAGWPRVCYYIRIYSCGISGPANVPPKARYDFSQPICIHIYLDLPWLKRLLCSPRNCHLFLLGRHIGCSFRINILVAEVNSYLNLNR